MAHTIVADPLAVILRALRGEFQRERRCCFLKLRAAGGAREGNHVADILHPGHKLDNALKA